MAMQETALDVDLTYDPQLRGAKILEDLDKIREITPAHWSAKSRCWLITRHKDVADVYLGKLPVGNADRMWPVFSMIPRDEWETRIPALIKYSELWITSTEGEKHKRLRLLLMKALNPKLIETMRPYARARAEQLIDQVLDGGGETEFNETVSRAMTGDVLFKLIGLPAELIPQLRDWAMWLMEGVGAAIPTPERLQRANRALEEMNRAVGIEIEKRRKEPQDDILTGMLHASENEDKLSLDEIFAQFHVLIVAGHDTTMNTLTLSLDALGRDKEAWAYVKAHPEKMPEIVVELARYTAMGLGQAKLVYEDFEIDGQVIKKGDMIAAMIAAANRDPEVFPSGDRIDFTRENRKSMVFAPGVHLCLGHMLARLQLTEFFGALARKIDKIEILDNDLEFMPIWVFRGVYQMNVRLTPAA